MKHCARTRNLSTTLVASLIWIAACGPGDKDEGTANGGSGGSSSGGSGGGSAFGGSGGSSTSGGSSGTAGSGANPFGGSSGTAGSTGTTGGTSGTVGGSGGSSSTGGAGGSTTPVAAAGTITDLESGKNYFEVKDAGIIGAWFTYGDATPGATLTPAMGMPFTPTMPGAGGSMYAACMKGSGFTMWGAGMGFNLNDPGDGKGNSAVKPFDGTPYTGITFWAKAAAPVTVKVKLPLADTDPAGGKCLATDTTGGPMGCYNHPVASLDLTATWEQKTIRWGDFAQEPGWGLQVPAPFPLTSLYGVRIEVDGKAGSFDICFDNVAFVK